MPVLADQAACSGEEGVASGSPLRTRQHNGLCRLIEQTFVAPPSPGAGPPRKTAPIFAVNKDVINGLFIPDKPFSTAGYGRNVRYLHSFRYGRTRSRATKRQRRKLHRGNFLSLGRWSATRIPAVIPDPNFVQCFICIDHNSHSFHRNDITGLVSLHASVTCSAAARGPPTTSPFVQLTTNEHCQSRGLTQATVGGDLENRQERDEDFAPTMAQDSAR